MFERFTNGARRSVVLAQEEARHLNHNYIGTEHLLLGLLGQGETVAARTLRGFGLSLAHVRADILELIGEGTEGAPDGHIPFTPRSKKVLELSLREALQLGHNHIGTEHILLGLVREGEGVAAQILVGRGADLPRVRAAVVDEMGRSGGAGEPRERRRTPAADEALADARQLAGSAALGSHHLLEALARSQDSLAGKVLASLGVDPEAVATKIDELGTDGTSDSTPAEQAARLMELRVEAGTGHVVLRDAATVELMKTIIHSVGEPASAGQAGGDSMVGLWQAIVGALEELRDRYAPPAEVAEAASGRSNIVRQAIQTRLARRRAR